MTKEELLEKLSDVLPDDANIVFATVTWWNEDGMYNWDSDSDEID